MAIQTITFSDKQAIGTQPSVPDVNKITDDDMNEIKSVVNNNATELGNIIESGSNANGNYIKFSDGTMICSKIISGTTNINESWGNGYTSGSASSIALGNWAVEFIATPIISITAGRNGSNYWLSGTDSTSKTYVGSLSIIRFTSATSIKYNLNIVGIGKWK